MWGDTSSTERAATAYLPYVGHIGPQTLLLKNGALGWIYAHLLSLLNLDRLNARLGQRIEAEKSAA